MRIQTFVAIGISLAFVVMAPLTAQTQWQVTKTFHIGADGGSDYLTVIAMHTRRLSVKSSGHSESGPDPETCLMS